MMVWVVDLTDTVSEAVSPGEGTPLAFSLSEDVFRQHHLLGYNHFSPLSKMGLDINESVTPKLIWDVSLASGKGGEDYNLMDVTPLALWDPNGGLNLATKDCETDGSFLEDELEPSEWVSTMIKGFGSFVGFPIACCERQCIDFFKKLEKVWEKQATVVNTLRAGISSQKGMRESKNLISTVNYEGQSGEIPEAD